MKPDVVSRTAMNHSTIRNSPAKIATHSSAIFKVALHPMRNEAKAGRQDQPCEACNHRQQEVGIHAVISSPSKPTVTNSGTCAHSVR